MDIPDDPHLICIIKTVGDLKNINVPKVHDETSVLPFDNSDAFKFVGKDVALIDLSRVLVLKPRVLADGSGINFYRNNDDAPVIVILNCALTRCVVNEVPTLIFEQVSALSFPIVDALASEFNFSHRLEFL